MPHKISMTKEQSSLFFSSSLLPSPPLLFSSILFSSLLFSSSAFHFGHRSIVVFPSQLHHFRDLILTTILTNKSYDYAAKTRWCNHKKTGHVFIDGLAQKRRNSSALAMNLRLSCINPSIWCAILYVNGGYIPRAIIVSRGRYPRQLLVSRFLQIPITARFCLV